MTVPFPPGPRFAGMFVIPIRAPLVALADSAWPTLRHLLCAQSWENLQANQTDTNTNT
jgi:hypothetical protein